MGRRAVAIHVKICLWAVGGADMREGDGSSGPLDVWAIVFAAVLHCRCT